MTERRQDQQPYHASVGTAEELSSLGREAGGGSPKITTHGPPLLPQVGIIAMVPYRWSALWQPCNHILTRLAKYFQVLWVEPAHQWREILTSHKDTAVRFLDCPSGFSVFRSPFWLPVVYKPRWLGQFILRRRLARARKLLWRRGCRKIVLYIWRPEFEGALTNLSFDLSCYHIDDEYSFSSVEIPIPEAELRLITNVDQVFVHSPALMEKKGKINPNTALVPNGVDYNAYARPVEIPADLARIPRPWIGYSGHVKKQLDWPLILDLTSRHPEWSFVFVGAVNTHPEVLSRIDLLSRRRNVFFLGSKTVEQLAGYPQHFDVCIMPYRRDSYTKYIYPLKLHEYLASGRPTIGAPLPVLQEFTGVLDLAGTVDEWSASIERALQPEANSPSSRASRQSIARRYDWEALVKRIAERIAEDLGPEFKAQIEAQPAGISAVGARTAATPSPAIRSLALLNPMGDYGTSAYTYELAEGLVANGVKVDVYSSGNTMLEHLSLLRRHRIFPVLGSVLFSQRELLKSGGPLPNGAGTPARNHPVSLLGRLWARMIKSRWFQAARNYFIAWELALYLKRLGYDLVWTQWPEMPGYGTRFWRVCKLLGIHMVHTVHNVFPHEERDSDRALCTQVYRSSDVLFVHSEFTRRSLIEEFPEVSKKVFLCRHGLYASMPRRPEAFDPVRERLHIAAMSPVVLICGKIRPYKNVEAILEAMSEKGCERLVLIVTGEESGYPEVDHDKPLARTQRLADQFGVTSRTRFLPGFKDMTELAELLEAADILALPYTKHYGSGLLLLGMTFGKHILATRTGGMEEYLEGYPRYTLIEGPSTGEVHQGLLDAAGAVSRYACTAPVQRPDLEWSQIGRSVLASLRNTL